MAQTGYTPIQLYRTTTSGAAPNAANLNPGELAININDADMALYAENQSGTVKRLMNNPAGLKYPTVDGTSGQAIVTDGSGNLTLATVGYLNIPQSGSDKVTAYTLASTDIGKYIGVGTSGSIVVPNATYSNSVAIANGDAISIFNNTAGNITLTMNTTTAYIGGTNTNKSGSTITLATRGVATILYLGSTSCVVTGNVS